MSLDHRVITATGENTVCVLSSLVKLSWQTMYFSQWINQFVTYLVSYFFCSVACGERALIIEWIALQVRTKYGFCRVLPVFCCTAFFFFFFFFFPCCLQNSDHQMVTVTGGKNIRVLSSLASLALYFFFVWCLLSLDHRRVTVTGENKLGFRHSRVGLTSYALLPRICPMPADLQS